MTFWDGLFFAFGYVVGDYICRQTSMKSRRIMKQEIINEVITVVASYIRKKENVESVMNESSDTPRSKREVN